MGEKSSYPQCPELLSDEESLPGSTFPIRRTYPLNSKRIVASQLQTLAKLLELPTGASASETRQIIEGQLLELGHQPQNVQVVVQEEESGDTSRLLLVDESGVIRDTGVIHPPPVSISYHNTNIDNTVRQHHILSPVNNGDGDALELRSALRDARRDNERLERVLSEQSLLLQKVMKQLEDTKVVTEQLQSYPATNLSQQQAPTPKQQAPIPKQQELIKGIIMEGALFGADRSEDKGSRSSSASMEKLSTQVEETRQAASYSNKKASQCLSMNHGHDHGDGRNQQQPVPTTPQDFVYPFEMQNRGRRGKAPPIDPFSGENPEVTIEEWLPSLQRAVDWNEWTEQEIFIQLAGHLRGRALQEWNLLDEDDKTNWQCAVKVLQSRLEHGNSTMAAQEFRHLYQDKKETVSEFISRLERTFRIAHGKARMPIESKEALLYGQLQEGLLYKLIESPAVSGAQDYKSLCVAARNEERRLVELSRRSQRHGYGANASYRQKEQSNQSGIPQTPRRSTQQTSSPRGPLTCYNCGGKNHLARNCRVAKSESTGQSGANTRNS